MSLLTGNNNGSTGFSGNPNVTVVRTNTNAGIAGVGAGMNVGGKKPKSRKGFFSFGGSRHDSEAQQTQQPAYGNIQFVPVPIYQDRHSEDSEPMDSNYPTHHSANGGGTPHAHAPVPPVPTPPSPPPQRSPPSDPSPPPEVQRSVSPMSHHSHHGHSRSVSHQSQPPPQQHHNNNNNNNSQPYTTPHQQPSTSTPGPSRLPPILEFDQETHPGFLNHSGHRVLYANRTYPTATHLHEALKFIEHRPDFAEQIRGCQSVQDVYPLSANLQGWVRPDWGMVFLDKMEEVLWNKFRQHPDLRAMLMGTGDTELVYADPNDGYWGSGSAIGEGRVVGDNRLGKLLVKVRERLRVEGLP